MKPSNHPPPTLILGTAMWGWAIPEKTCFALLDEFYQNGFREIDGATNYPINKNPNDFRKSERILQQWIKSNGVHDLKIMMKVGSINNLRTPDHNLSKSFLLICYDEYQHQFEGMLDTLMVHWDNREVEKEIEQTMEAFEIFHNAGLRVGLSGIKYPSVYAKLNQKNQFDFRIQIKHNLLYSDYHRYEDFHGKSRFITYGINAGGIKLNEKSYTVNSSLKLRNAFHQKDHIIITELNQLIEHWNQQFNNLSIQNFNHCGMCYAFHSSDIEGILLGTSHLEQLKDSINFYQKLLNEQYWKLFQKLSQLSSAHV